MNCRILEENGSIGIALDDGRRFSLNSVQGTLHAEPFKNGVKITVSGENPEWSFSPADTEVPYRWRMMVYPTFYSIFNVDCGWHPTEEDDCFFGALGRSGRRKSRDRRGGL